MAPRDPKARAISTTRKTKTVAKAPEKKYLCPYCLKEKVESSFYVSSDPMNMTGRTVMCKACAEKIACQWNDATHQFDGCTKASIQEVLERLDKPFLDDLWNSSYFEYMSNKENYRRKNIWDTYIKNIAMPQYKTLRWRDGDVFSAFRTKALEDARSEVKAGQEDIETNRNEEINNEYLINRSDVIRMIGYDPFSNYPNESDKPVLYAQLVSFIDEETKNDGMKMNAVIQIVQAFNQIQKINDAINELSSDVMKLNNNNGTIKQHADTISKLLSGANALAKDNGINTLVPVPGDRFEKTSIEVLGSPESKTDYKVTGNGRLECLKTVLIG